MTDPLLLSDTLDDGSRVLTLNRPHKRNALSDALVGALLNALQEARQQQVATVVLRGAGKNFSAGFDFTDVEQLSAADLLWRFVRVQQLLDQIGSYPGLTIAQAHGRNFGAGCDLIAACNIRQGTPDSRFRMPGVRFGLVLGTRRLGQLIGADAARHLQLTAGELSAKQAHELGFLSHIIEQADQLDAALYQGCQAISPATRQQIVQALSPQYSSHDMSRLVESVMTGDIKARLRTYLNG